MEKAELIDLIKKHTEYEIKDNKIIISFKEDKSIEYGRKPMASYLFINDIMILNKPKEQP